MERLAKIYRENENFRLILKLFFILLMSRLFMLVLMVIYNVYMGTDRSIAFLMNQWDAKRYQFMIDIHFRWIRTHRQTGHFSRCM